MHTFNIVRDESPVITEYCDRLTARKITVLRSVWFIVQQVNA